MERVKAFVWLVTFFVLLHLVLVVVEGSESLLSPKGVNYEGFIHIFNYERLFCFVVFCLC